jgi:hypothetical protein
MTSIEQPCGCKIAWYNFEVEPGKWTVLDDVTLCPRHQQEHWDDLIKRQEEEQV